MTDVELADVHQALQRRGETVAVAESLTGGLLAAALTSTPGASLSFRGGLVVYATDLKASLGGVDPSLLAARGAVDPMVAQQLAQGVRNRLGASWGIGVTGVAGPDPQDGQPVGRVFIAIAGARGETVAQHNFSGDRNTIRLQTVQVAVRLLAASVDSASVDSIDGRVERTDV
jgi:nicotinamide-nucleotide amidase